ncbi:MAG: ATP-dependent RecD-like DNA helicase [Oscillospiraceae bacterium]|nr:ATP-dependent RecD-like DNA helicase [Oscillospiraceae bacterium]MDD4546692.1 ATP-dependent RecD-like DNA helicase [Oscillospiraceae bacterium]
MDEKSPELLKGSVEQIVYRNENSNWTVLELESEEKLHKVVGVLPMIGVGEILNLSGRWVDHPSFGRQFRAEYCERHLPVEGDAILRYLSSGIIKGIGPKTAIRIVEKFKDKSLEIISNEPNRLTEIKGISPSRAEKIAQEYARQFGLREVMLAFADYGLTPSEAFRSWKRWGNTTIEQVRANPYLLCSSGLYIGFERADRICMNMGRPADDPGRIEAGILYVLRHNLNNGHTCLPADKLINVTVSMLGVTKEQVSDMLDEMVSSFVVKEEMLADRRFIFLNYIHKAEKYTAARIQSMLQSPPPSVGNAEKSIDRVEKRCGITYAEQQRLAIIQALKKGILILTGGPGTGKTTALDAIITLLEEMGQTVAITAPTGRAAKRMIELTGKEAKTIHRLLEVKWDDEDTPAFERNENNPLDADAVVVDELSMVDSILFESLLRALKTGCRLIMVGDSDQLPAVGAGSVLHDLIESGELPTVQLTEVFRQAMQSNIVNNAHRIVSGKMPVLNYRQGDFFFMPQNDTQNVVQTVLDLCSTRLPSKYGITVGNGIQVLCPARKGELGTQEMNRRLQELINPKTQHNHEMVVEGVTLRTGDKVMHTRNNYDIAWTKDGGEIGQGVFNGDIGILEQVNPRDSAISVRYDDRVALYNVQDAKDLELAYAVTVHKSQGSEFEAVILPIFRNIPLLCYRNLLYTAVTRAKSLLIIVGSKLTIKEMVDNNRKTMRYTGLRYFLTQGHDTQL